MNAKKNNKVQNNVQNQQVNNNGCQHVQLGGIAYYDDKQYFLFSPDSVNQGGCRSFFAVMVWLSKCKTEHLIS